MAQLGEPSRSTSRRAGASSGRHRTFRILAASLTFALLVPLTAPHTTVKGAHSPAPLTSGTADARDSWHFTPASEAISQMTLILFNPRDSQAHVWIRASSTRGIRFWSVTVKRKIIRAVRLPADIMRDAVSLLADRKIIASRLVQGGPSPRYTFGEPGTWKPSPKTMPMPEQRWHFPPLPTAPDVILLKIFNPNPIAVQATVQIVGTGVRTQARVSPQTSYEMSLSLTVQTHAFDALLVTATGAIIPERWAFSPAGPRLTYGTPLSATR